MNLHHHTSLPQFQNMLLPHFFLVYTFYTINVPIILPRTTRPSPRQATEDAFLRGFHPSDAVIQADLQMACRWGDGGKIFMDIPIKNWINNDSYGYGLYTGWWLTYPSEK